MALELERSERNEWLARYQSARQRLGRLTDAGGDPDAVMAAADEVGALERGYAAGLPRLALSRCPFDDRPLHRSFDPFGLDGLWWHKNASPEEPAACPHFCALGGAVGFNGHPPRGGAFPAHTGPEVPFVYPRLLNLPGMVAVISEVPMDPGYTAYPIAYFAPRRPPAQELTAGWRRTVYSWVSQLGDSDFRIENDAWDFELRPWLEQGKLRWCVPGPDGPLLSDAPAAACPYLDLPGKREYLVVEGERCREIERPDGSFISPYED